MLYVALSHTTELQGLHIIGNCKPPVEKNVNDPIAVEMKRLREDKYLNLSYNTLKNITGKIVVFQNSRSLKKHVSKVVKDE